MFQSKNFHGILGQTTDYPKTYTPDILYPISRESGRNQFTPKTSFLGVDWWHAFEISWLNPQGVSQVAMARFTIPADSPFIIESKSLKLYLNSLNFTEFANQQAIITTIQQDLSQCLQTNVGVEFLSVYDSQSLSISQPEGQCIDDALNHCQQKFSLTTIVDSKNLLLSTPKLIENQQQCYFSHLLRSNCPVTNQPDWGTLQIIIDCPPIDTAGLLRYVLSFREHNGFHEQCVEQIFHDLTQSFSPKSLMVRAWYTRRGGIDINPCRVSHLDLLPPPSRTNRQ